MSCGEGRSRFVVVDFEPREAYEISYAGDANNNSFSSRTESVGVTIVSVP